LPVLEFVDKVVCIDGGCGGASKPFEVELLLGFELREFALGLGSFLDDCNNESMDEAFLRFVVVVEDVDEEDEDEDEEEEQASAVSTVFPIEFPKLFFNCLDGEDLVALEAFTLLLIDDDEEFDKDDDELVGSLLFLTSDENDGDFLRFDDGNT
jgi:hypothetical protein